jgi:hypothetical protein
MVILEVGKLHVLVLRETLPENDCLEAKVLSTLGSASSLHLNMSF